MVSWHLMCSVSVRHNWTRGYRILHQQISITILYTLLHKLHVTLLTLMTMSIIKAPGDLQTWPDWWEPCALECCACTERFWCLSAVVWLFFSADFALASIGTPRHSRLHVSLPRRLQETRSGLMHDFHNYQGRPLADVMRHCRWPASWQFIQAFTRAELHRTHRRQHLSATGSGHLSGCLLYSHSTAPAEFASQYLTFLPTMPWFPLASLLPFHMQPSSVAFSSRQAMFNSQVHCYWIRHHSHITHLPSHCQIHSIIASISARLMCPVASSHPPPCISRYTATCSHPHTGMWPTSFPQEDTTVCYVNRQGTSSTRYKPQISFDKWTLYIIIITKIAMVVIVVTRSIVH